MSDLLDALDELTLPKHTPVIQDIMHTTTIDGEILSRPTGKTRKQFVTTDALITQLENAIRSSIGGNAAGASLAHERSILDNVALYEAMRISSTIGDWCRIHGATHNRQDMTGSLRAWYVAYQATNPTEQSESGYLRQLHKWARFIEGKLDPWRERELPDNCPACGAREWWRNGERYFHPLVVRYKPDGADLLQEARAMCRSCEQVWQVRELAYAIEHQAEERAADG